MRMIISLRNKIDSYLLRVRTERIKKSFAECGKSFKIYGRPIITAPERITIGDRVVLNNGCILNAEASKIEIGNNVVISANAIILGATLDTFEFIHQNRFHINKPVHIGDNVWICAGAIICPGVKILGGGVVIAAGAVVTKDITESNIIVGGNPAHVIKRFDSDLEA